MLTEQATHLVEILRWRGAHQRDDAAVTFLDGQGDGATWTFGELDRHARAVAATLSQRAEVGDRALLLCPPGLDFVGAILGCFYAGVVAIPAYPPANARHMGRIDAMVKDADAHLVVTTSGTRDRIIRWLDQRQAERPLTYLGVDEIEVAESDGWTETEIRGDSLAFLQYTSGSTSRPKGVMVSHSNLLANLRMIERSFGHTPDSPMVSWLPMFHDMGLIGNMLEPLYLGAQTVLMAPLSFIRRPASWLEAITRFRPRWIGAPNFGYALAADNSTSEQRRMLDLSSLRVAYCGSEPIDHRVVRRFADVFADCGFRSEAFYPCYGLAEATLLAAGSTPGTGARVSHLDGAELARHRAVAVDAGTDGERVLVGCGHAPEGQTLAIVDPEARLALPERQVGEIWLRGGNVAAGYWRNPAATREVFLATLADDPQRPYLRTGDLGFLDDGQLFVTGRIKDVIIIRGRNHYPHDIERTVEGAHPALQPTGAAAFSVGVGDEERLVVVQEVRRTWLRQVTRGEPATGEIANAVRSAVLDEHELAVLCVVLLSPATLAKTSSGKVRRGACRDAFLTSQLAVVAAHPAMPETLAAIAMPGVGAAAATAAADAASAGRATEAIVWLRAYAERRIDSRLIDERRAIPPHVVLDFGNHGLLGLSAPAATGGLELCALDALRVLEQLAAIDTTLASFVGVHNALGLRPLLRYGTEAQQERLVPALSQGRDLGSFAFTEPAAGSNPTAIQATAIADGDGGWRLTGEKRWIGTAAWAGTVHVFAHLVDEEGHRRGITGFVVRSDAEGFESGAEELTLGMRGMVQNTIHLRDVYVGAGDLLGEAGQGMAIAQDIMEFGRVCIAAVSLGAMKRCAQLMTRYARQRTIATGRLLDNIVTRERLTQVTVEITALGALVRRVAGWLDQGVELPKEYYAAIKVLAAEAAYRAADTLVQLLGGRGYIETNLAPQLLRDVRLLRVFEGPSETMQMFVGHRLVVDNHPFCRFLREQLGAAEAANGLEQASQQVATETLDGQRAAMLLGDLGTWTLWLAVVDAAREDTVDATVARRAEHAAAADEAVVDSVAERDPSTVDEASVGLEAARGWLRQRRDGALSAIADALRGDGPPALPGEHIEAIVRGYESSIGDLEQRRAGVADRLDPLLARESTLQPRVVSTTRRTLATPEAPARPPLPPPAVAGRRLAIESWLERWIASRMHQPAAKVLRSRPFAELGLDSLTAVELAEQLATWLGVPVSPTATWDHPTIEHLAAHLSGSADHDTAPAPVAAAPLSPTAEPLQQLNEHELARVLADELADLEREQG